MCRNFSLYKVLYNKLRGYCQHSLMVKTYCRNSSAIQFNVAETDSTVVFFNYCIGEKYNSEFKNPPQ